MNRFILVVLFTLQATAAMAQCVGLLPTSPSNNFRAMHITLDASLSPFSGNFSSAANAWNTACASISGMKMPELSTSDPGGDWVGTIHFEFRPNDHAPTKLCGNGTEYCRGEFPDGGNPIIYGYAGAANNLVSWSSLTPTLRTRLIEHELGHALGLDDGGCGGGIMTLPVDTTSGVLGAECSQADHANAVPHEGTPNEGCDSFADCHQSPIILNLGATPYRLTSVEDGVSFDIDGDLDPERVAWTAAGTEQAFLWLDRNGNGIVDGGAELFGDLRQANGFEALKVYDKPNVGPIIYGGNGDGVIDRRDAVWSRLRLWFDRNHDGVCTPDEVSDLDAQNVVALGLDYRESMRRDAYGNLFRYVSVVALRGPHGPVLRPVYDVFLGMNP